MILIDPDRSFLSPKNINLMKESKRPRGRVCLRNLENPTRIYTNSKLIFRFLLTISTKAVSLFLHEKKEPIFYL